MWDRLSQENRLAVDDARESNVVFKRPYEEVTADFYKCLAYAYEPSRLFARYDRHSRVTLPNRRLRVYSEVTGKQIWRGLRMLAAILWKLGVFADYRRDFSTFAWPRPKAGKIEKVITAGMMEKHLIAYARKACVGEMNSSHYSLRVREPRVAGLSLSSSCSSSREIAPGEKTSRNPWTLSANS